MALVLSGNLQCPKALLQRCGNRSLPQCCGNALRHCGLLQCAQRIAAMAPLRQYCGNEVLQQYCSNAAAIAVLQQHCGNAHCKVLLQYCGNRGHCGNALWHCRNTPIFSRCADINKHKQQNQPSLFETWYRHFWRWLLHTPLTVSSSPRPSHVAANNQLLLIVFEFLYHSSRRHPPADINKHKQQN